jgi:hypothetical protein
MLVSLCWKPVPLQALWGASTPAFFCRLVYLQLMWGLPLSHSPAECATWGKPLPLSPELRMPRPLCYVSFLLVTFLLFSFLFCASCGSVYPGGYADFSQGWLWGYRVLLICSPVGLPSRLGAGVWWHRSLLGFSIYCGLGKLCAGWGCGSVRVLPLLGGFSCPECFQCLTKIFTLRNTCYLLSPSSL